MIVVAYCRAGFEAETAIDISRVAEAAGCRVDARAGTAAHRAADCGYVTAAVDGLDLRRWRQALVDVPPMFARSMFVGSGPHAIAAPRDPATAAPSPRAGVDRVAPLVTAIAALGTTASDLWLEYPDTNDGKAMSTLARALAPRVGAALRTQGLLPAAAAGAEGNAVAERNRKRFHVFLVDGATAYVGVSIGESGSRWPMGIARLRMPGAAPSRSTLKLAEALMTFLGERETTLLRAGMRAVDLGAAPGGWTWQLAQRGVRVTSVDNGALKGEVAQDPLVTHVRADGLRFRPKRPVDWVLCDIVEQPARIAALMGSWIADGDARRALFNLKLPMKKRYDEVLRAADTIDTRLSQAGVDATLQFRQLYHDRAEITAYLARTT